ncbi:hypothetical protein DFH06DRAFT_1467841 [Mycena polygramma]|nr:hypothetical protein DFH06DRAFT_1467841 [Mycena polygramma]
MLRAFTRSADKLLMETYTIMLRGRAYAILPLSVRLLTSLFQPHPIISVSSPQPSPNATISNSHPTPPLPTPTPTTGDGSLSESETYCNQMLHQKRGFPLYVPGPQPRPAEYREKGISIGDVGSVTSDGGFDFYFNIFLSAEHPINANRTPEDFSPMQLYDLEDISDHNYRLGNYVSTSTVQRMDLDGAAGTFPGGHFVFSCDGPRGAVLALPDGAHLQKLQNLESMRAYAAKHVENWYNYINGPRRGRGLGNGDLCLITGCEKARSWGMASYCASRREFQLFFRPTAVEGATYRPYNWGGTHGQINPSRSQSHDPPSSNDPLNQTTFIHGWSISLPTGVWGRLFGSVQTSSIVDFQLLLNASSSPSCSTAQGSSYAWLFNLFAGRSTTGGSQHAGQHRGAILSDLSPTAMVVNPGKLINEYIFYKLPQATGVVMTHHDDWCDILGDDGLQDPSDFFRRINEQFTITEKDGATFLTPKLEHSLADSSTENAFQASATRAPEMSFYEERLRNEMGSMSHSSPILIAPVLRRRHNKSPLANDPQTNSSPISPVLPQHISPPLANQSRSLPWMLPGGVSGSLMATTTTPESFTTNPSLAGTVGRRLLSWAVPTRTFGSSQIGRSGPSLDADSEFYCRQMLLQRRGFPLYIPNSPGLPAERREHGIEIGDVGSITPEGGFDFYFNIFYPAEHPINANRTPQGFVPMQPYNLSDVLHKDLQPGDYVATSTVQKMDLDPPAGEFPGGHFVFSCSSPQGAVLALPDGAHFQRLTNVGKLQRYAAYRAESWYRYINGARGRQVSNGGLVLVTGYEKARSWGIASFSATPENFQLFFEPRAGAADKTYHWRTSGKRNSAKTQSYDPSSGDSPTNQTVFMHGLSIQLGAGVWGKLFGTVTVSSMADILSQGSSSLRAEEREGARTKMDPVPFTRISWSSCFLLLLFTFYSWEIIRFVWSML